MCHFFFFLVLQACTSLDDSNYIVEMLENYPLRLLAFLKAELNQYLKSVNIPYCTPLSRYLNRYNIVEMYLDNILKSRDDSKLPFEVPIVIYDLFNMSTSVVSE